MNTDKIAVMMRAQELQRRTARAKRVLNELALSQEPLTPMEQQFHKYAIKKLQEQQLQREREQSPGYWQRLWAALLNK